MATPASHKLAAGLTAIYGLAAIAGGVTGYLVTAQEGKASLASLIGGGASGVVLLICAALFLRWRMVAALGTIAVAGFLVYRFAPKVWEARETLNDFVGTPVGAVAVSLTLGGVLVILLSLVALAQKRRPD